MQDTKRLGKWHDVDIKQGGGESNRGMMCWHFLYLVIMSFKKIFFQAIFFLKKQTKKKATNSNTPYKYNKH